MGHGWYVILFTRCVCFWVERCLKQWILKYELIWLGQEEFDAITKGNI